ncbi:hypothetical protein [Desulfobacula phenolica]|uniref:Uncharacterized protein n=1 Tax=Desulfobacula phenolica TaxID=90732 RepID=A0A1H2DLL9_9BACT|nr:hypothetical protein [Desulfobacula phenolica]SDT83827.1 hypothetical protein SAMN04487931_10131 [Desulfobacula phenolica]
MTNVNSIHESAQSLAALNTRISKSQKTGAFETAFTKALDRTKTPEMELTSTNALREIASKGLDIMTSSDIVSGKTDKLLEMLDSYSSKLDDRNVSLKNIAPVLEKIKDQAGNLLKETERLTDADANLKKIATQTIITAQTEYLKFQRGDYLS